MIAIKPFPGSPVLSICGYIKNKNKIAFFLMDLAVQLHRQLTTKPIISDIELQVGKTMCVMVQFGYNDMSNLMVIIRATPPTSPQQAQHAACQAEQEQCQMGLPPGHCQPQKLRKKVREIKYTALILPALATSLAIGNSKKPCGILHSNKGDFYFPNPAAVSQPLDCGPPIL